MTVICTSLIYAGVILTLAYRAERLYRDKLAKQDPLNQVQYTELKADMAAVKHQLSKIYIQGSME